ncbi:MAG: hypothetical protein OEN23_17315 [Paracoccaceae bacterium]|nr:hypothetical protein [Paracoccaceae bacterium]
MATLIGTALADTITGTFVPDNIFGRGGDDSLFGDPNILYDDNDNVLAGNDTIRGVVATIPLRAMHPRLIHWVEPRLRNCYGWK